MIPHSRKVLFCLRVLGFLACYGHRPSLNCVLYNTCTYQIAVQGDPERPAQCSHVVFVSPYPHATASTRPRTRSLPRLARLKRQSEGYVVRRNELVGLLEALAERKREVEEQLAVAREKLAGQQEHVRRGQQAIEQFEKETVEGARAEANKVRVWAGGGRRIQRLGSAVVMVLGASCLCW